MKTKQFNPQATQHLGEIRFQDSSTPIGVNGFGLTFEDATYHLGEHTMSAFHKKVLAAMLRGETSGTFGKDTWEYVGKESCYSR